MDEIKELEKLEQKETTEEQQETEDNQEKKKNKPLKDTSDELSLSADELQEIIAKSKDEYAKLGNQNEGSKIPIILLLFGIVIMLILISKSVRATKDVVVESSNTESVTLTLDKDANVVESYQNISK